MNGFESYAGTLNTNKQIKKFYVGHANHHRCKGKYTFHVHPKKTDCSYVPSYNDLIFVYLSLRNYDLDTHYLFTHKGVWEMKYKKGVSFETIEAVSKLPCKIRKYEEACRKRKLPCKHYFWTAAHKLLPPQTIYNVLYGIFGN